MGRDRNTWKPVYSFTDEEEAFMFEQAHLRTSAINEVRMKYYMRQHECDHRVISRVIIHGRIMDYSLDRGVQGRTYYVCVICGSSRPNPQSPPIPMKPNRVTIHGGNDLRYLHLAGTVYPSPY